MLNQSKYQETGYLTEEQAAKHINMSRSFLRHHRQHGFLERKAQGPKYIRIGRTIRYHVRDLDGWMFAHRREEKF